VEHRSDIAPLIPAATVLLLREQNGRLEVLMLRRNRALKAFGGAWVFPGGRVDDVDVPEGDELMRAKAAAIRETQEETGLDISGQNMAVLSCWIPPITEKRRFSTWFFVAKAPDKSVKIDEGEIHDYRWVCPKETITKIPSPDIMIMPPTYVSLYELSRFNAVKAAITEIDQREPEHFETRFFKSDSGFTTVWYPDAAYETGDIALDGPRRRLECRADEWRYVKSI